MLIYHGVSRWSSGVRGAQRIQRRSSESGVRITLQRLFSIWLGGRIISPRVGFEFCRQGITLEQAWGPSNSSPGHFFLFSLLVFPFFSFILFFLVSFFVCLFSFVIFLSNFLSISIPKEFILKHYFVNRFISLCSWVKKKNELIITLR